jgi:nitroreductase
MERLVDARHPILDLLRRRWSPRAFNPNRPVEPGKLRSLMEAARWAPSSNNEQPWHFIVATKDNPGEFGRVLACLVEKNQSWANHAPALMITVASNVFGRNGKPNRHAFHDVGQAVANMTVQATALDLFVHQMAGFSPDAARHAFGIPETAEAVTAVAVGYLGDANLLPEDLRQRETAPTTRKPITDFAFEGKWGQTANWARS